MKVVIPVAGAGTRLRPHTFTQPKPLMPVAGKPIIAFIIDTLAETGLTNFVFVIGYLGEKVRTFIEQQYPHLQTEFVYQEHREGSGHAVWMAKDAIQNEDQVFIAFGDTIFDADLKQMLDCPHSCVGVKKVVDPREFGVADMDENNMITRMIEKPRIPKSNMAMVGLYKVNEVQALLGSIEQLIKTEQRTVGEYQLTDALQGMLEQGIPFQAITVNNWFDCGRKDVLLETNAMLLSQRGYATDVFKLPEFENTIVIHPIAVGENCTISNSIVGPHVTIGNNVTINSSIIKDSIIGNFASLDDVVLQRSVVGSDATIKGTNLSLNIGDNTEIDL
ncbi:MAG: NTP transferase domain-containing protein [Lewinellaceae bacterium]|nr:NTP transferase domain-containing protein [Saprospiraceae bacterium]MCB9317068.1 NTP transferase domain-containing protein [Lewinellaceae bacterium]MCB9334259.1 NTP transferase domain-containing protein [Lewinellaceae bacterium]